MAQCNIEWMPLQSGKELQGGTMFRELSCNDFQGNGHNNDTAFLHINYTYPDSIQRLFKHAQERLKWDFSPAAVSFVYIGLIHNTLKDTLQLDIFSCFVYDSSYMTIKSNDILMHEQIHFNIVEIFARKVKAEICKSPNLYANSKKVENLVLQFQLKADMMNAKFDRELHMVADKESVVLGMKLINKRWQEETTKQLEELSKFSDPRGAIIIQHQIKN